MTDTIFGKITRGEIPTEFLYEDDLCVVIRDIHPQAPTHVLIIPRKPIPKLADAALEDQALLGHLLLGGQSGGAVGCRRRLQAGD